MSHSVNPRMVPRAGHRGMIRLMVALIILCGVATLRPAYADNTVLDWNNEFLTIIQQTSVSWVDGPPEVGREMAIIGNAMADAVTAASGGGSYYAYSGGAVTGANASVAAATAAYAALSSIFNDAAWQTPTTTPTGGGTPASTLANTIVLPEISSFLSNQLTSLGLTDPSSCGSSSSALCLGYNLGISAATAVIGKVAGDGAVASIQNGLNTNKPTGSGTTPGVYVAPGTRPEMMPTWGGVTPMGVTPAQVASAQAQVNGPPSIGSAAYANALLQTECQGSSAPLISLPANIQSACAAAGFAQETTAEANAALFWNDPG
ncbi:MAG: hypothetical protein QOH05_747, partial [Acetobacteraceae bacterium]|nr:hypothetical protein [Acetobacteraceae bacterium]